ncbi:MAG: ferritin [Anaerolineales bacterium]|nr:ferritin [Anaerolineales bacterium]
MFSKKMHQAMNDQIQHELYSAYIYLSMSAYFESENYPGFAQWMRIQFEEEMAHAFRFYDYIHSRGERVTLLPIGQPPAEYESPLVAFEAALEHEQKITGDIHRLYALATEENDYPSLSFLQWFIDEQVEEEEHVGGVVDNVKRVSGVSHAMLMLDRELGQRQPPADVEGE